MKVDAFPVLVERLAVRHPDLRPKQIRVMTAFMTAFGHEADEEGQVPELSAREWCDRAELVLVAAGYLADGSEPR